MKNNNIQIKRLCRAFLALETEKEAELFLNDLCTIPELREMSNRLEAAVLLKKGHKYNEISEVTGVSTATISRVNSCINYGGGGYTTIIERIEKENTDAENK